MSRATDKRQTRLQSALAGAPGWVGGALTGIQAALLGLVVVLAPAFAATAAAPTTNGSAAIDWMSVTKVSVRLWLLAHGVPYMIGDITFTLIPLGLTAIIVAIIVAIARRFCTKTWSSWAIATATYAVLVCAAEVAATHGQGGVTGRTVQTAAVSVLIAGPAVAAGIWRAHGAEFGWVARIPAVTRTGLRLGVATVAASLSVAAVVAGGFTYLGRGRIADAVTALGIDPLGGSALAFAEALYAPNISVWMLGWISGQGFVVGEGSLYSPSVVTPDALPAFPIFGALPTIEGGYLVWAPLAIVGIAAVARLIMRRRIGAHWLDLTAVLASVAVVGVAVSLVGMVASGAIGPGRLATVGVEVAPVALTCAGLAAAGFLIAHGWLALYAWLRRRAGWGKTEPALRVVPEPASDEQPVPTA